MRRISFDILPIRDHAFFEQAVLEGDLGQRLLELTGFGTERLDFIGGRLACGVTGEPLLAGFEKLFRPSVVEVLGDAFFAAELGDAVLAAQAFDDDADFLLGREVPPSGSPNVPDGFLRALRTLPGNWWRGDFAPGTTLLARELVRERRRTHGLACQDERLQRQARRLARWAWECRVEKFMRPVGHA